MKIKIQQNAKDCGLVCLQSFHYLFYKKWLPIESLRKDVFFDQNGVSIANLAILCKNIGLELEAYKVSAAEIIATNYQEKSIILISNQGYNHYVIFLSRKNNQITYLDPTFGKKTISTRMFKIIFEGVLIEIKQNKAKYEIVRNKTNNPFQILLLNQNYIFLIILITLITCIFVLTSSIYVKLLFDNILPSFKEKQLLLLTIIFIMISIFRAINKYLFSFVKIRLETKIALELTTKLTNHFIDIPLIDSEKYEINDKLKRVQAIQFISQYVANLSETYFSSILLGLTSIITIFIIDVQISIFAVIALGIIFLLSVLNKKNNYKKYKTLINNQLLYSKSIYEIVLSTPENKKTNFRNVLFTSFKKNQRKLIENQLTLINFNNIFVLFRNSIIFAFPYLIYFGATKRIFQNDMELGSMIVFIAMFGFLTTAIENFSSSLVLYSQYQNQYNLFNNFMSIKKEKINIKGHIIKQIKNLKFENFSFGYGFNQEIIKIKKLIIDENIYLEGENGSGKSTILKNIASFYSTDNVFVNGIELKLINLEDYRNKTILISNNFFTPTIKVIDFLTKKEAKYQNNLMKNLEKYSLFSILKQYKISLSKIIVNNGQEFSTGQKQIINLLQLFSKKYNLILLDESFSSIDKFVREKLINSIFQFQKKAIFIATSHNKKILPIKKVVKINEINTIN